MSSIVVRKRNTPMHSKLWRTASTIRNYRVLLLMLMPAIIYVVVFSYIPMAGVVLAFKNFNYAQGIFDSPWAGLSQFKFLFISNKLWPLTRNTLLYNFAFIVVDMTLEVAFAVIINEIRCKWFKKAFQSFIFLPYFLSWVIILAVLQAMMSYDYGFINKIIIALGGERINIYVNAGPWPFLLVFFHSWKYVGYGAIVYLASISGIDQQIYEAADIDGANTWQKIFKVTIPSLLPTMVIMFLLSVGQIFRGDFGMFFQMIGNNGVLLEVGDILDLYVYRAMAYSSNISMAAAAGFYQSVLCFVTIVSVNYLVKRIQPDYTLF
jgi:putative aldouronate transport system permease protein